MKLADINESLNLKDTDQELASEDFDSIGGVLIEALDHVPEEQEEVILPTGVRLVVDKMDKTRIDKVHVFFQEKEEDNKEEDEN